MSFEHIEEIDEDPDIIEENDELEEGTELDENEKKVPVKPVVIKLEKHMTENDFIVLIIKMDEYLKDKPEYVKITTESWKNDARPYQMINAAKKLFEKAIINGLMGCLILHGYHRAAQELYVTAYIRAKKQGDLLAFRNIDPNHFSSISTLSMNKYVSIIDSVHKKKMKSDI